MYPYEQAVRHAEALLASGNSAAAIEPLRDALTAAPDRAYPHLLLSRALRDQRRLIGARYEAERAIEIEPLSADAHLELALALLLQQHHKRALVSAEEAIDLAPGDAYAHLVRARILRHLGKPAEAQASLARALELGPTVPAVIAERGYAALDQGKLDIVDACGREILHMNAHNSDGLVLLGHAQLAAGDAREALNLALAALSHAPTDLPALYLLASVKMKRNPLGGLWWRWNRLLVKLGQSRAIFFVVGVWVTYRWADIASQDFGLPALTSELLSVVYLVFVLYTLSADVIVRRLVAKEVQQVRIKPNF